MSVRLDTGRLDRRVESKMSASGLCSGGGHTALVASTDTAPPEVFALEEGGLRKLTHHNDAVMEEIALGSVEDISFPSRDGTTIHGLMVKPRGLSRRTDRIRRCYGSMAAPTGKTHTGCPSTPIRWSSSGNGSRRTDTWCWPSIIAAAADAVQRSPRPSAPTGATRKWPICSLRRITRCVPRSPTRGASASVGGATAAC